MPMQRNHGKAYESRRSRELYKYYSPPTQIAITSTGESCVAPSAEQEAAIDPALTSSDDSALSAFALLLANQLNCKRAMISLLDSTNQYIVAESTRTLSLYHPHEHSADDGLWLGGAETIPREGGLCIGTLLLDPATESEEDKMMLTIDDLSTHEQFGDYPFVKEWPYLRFYAGVPLRTHNSINIGSLCVVDDKPRPGGLTEHEKQTMWKMSETIMNYLELVRRHNDLLRTRKMSDGLGMFISGGVTDRPYRTRPKRKSNKMKMKAAERLHIPSMEVVPESPTIAPIITPPTGSGSSSGGSTTKPSDIEPLSPPSAEKPPTTVNETFQRAAKVLHEALEVDGFIFVDADYSEGGTTPMPSFAEGTSKEASYLSRHRNFVLGHSGGPYEMLEINRPCIDGILDKYPHGRVFQYGESAESDSDYEVHPDTITSDSSSSGSSIVNIKDMLRRFLKQSRSAVVVPLYNAAGAPFAVGFGWTCRRDRVLVEESETAYLAAFNSSIMAEISRLSILNADRAKGDFISSVSHELRSPLHGVLASTEFLQETDLTELQESFVRIIESCGRTLLSTINHVLDFGKLNSSVEISKKGAYEKRSSICATDLASITEEVAAVVFASSDFKPAEVNSPLGMSGGLQEQVVPIIDIQKRDEWTFVTEPEAFRRILLNITGNAMKYTSKGWIKISLQAEDLSSSGPVGESMVTLRVSDSGKGISKEFIKNKLFTPFSQEDSMVSGTGLGLSIVKQLVNSLGGKIKIRSEVGQGTDVTVTFKLLRTKFAQLGRRPSFPVDGSVSVEGPALSAQTLTETRTRLNGRKVRLVGFESPGDQAEGVARGMNLLSGSLQSYLTNWLGIEVVDQSDGSSWDQDIVIANHCATLRQVLDNTPQQTRAGKAGGPALLVLCANPSQFSIYSSDLWKQDMGALEVRIKPCGPKKIIDALLACLNKLENPKTPSSGEGSPRTRVASPATDALRIEMPPRVVLKSYDSGVVLSDIPDNKQIVETELSDLQKVHVKLPDYDVSPGELPRVLVVDDNNVNLALLSTYLKKKGYTYKQARDGLEAFNIFKAEPAGFDAVLMDIQMPIMDGLQSTSAIREYEVSNRMKKRATVIALTGLSTAEDKEQAFKSGIDLFLVKPISFKNLEKILKDLKPYAT